MNVIERNEVFLNSLQFAFPIMSINMKICDSISFANFIKKLYKEMLSKSFLF